MMGDGQFLLLIIRLITGFAAAFTAVLLWSKTREPAWLFIVLGTVFLFGEIIFTALETLGLSKFYLFTVYGISLINVIFASFPFIFFTIGFTLFLRNKRRRF